MMGQKPNTNNKDLFNETLINIYKRLDRFNEFWKRVKGKYQNPLAY